jgi:hypothetical protein
MTMGTVTISSASWRSAGQIICGLAPPQRGDALAMIGQVPQIGHARP